MIERAMGGSPMARPGNNGLVPRPTPAGDDVDGDDGGDDDDDGNDADSTGQPLSRNDNGTTARGCDTPDGQDNTAPRANGLAPESSSISSSGTLSESSLLPLGAAERPL